VASLAGRGVSLEARYQLVVETDRCRVIAVAAQRPGLRQQLLGRSTAVSRQGY
jgi:hypothetical protein